MDNVYDFFSRRNMRDLAQQDYKRNEETVNERGRYIGVLPKNETKVVRDLVDQLGRKKAQIDQLVAEWNTLYEGYAFMMSGVLALLNVDMDEFHPETDDIYVDKDGHVWIVKRE